MLPDGRALMALAFVLGMTAGAALVAWRRGKSVLAGRRCLQCGSTLSLWPRWPALSWIATRPRCGACGDPAPFLYAAVEAAVVVIGVAAILAAPPGRAVLYAAGGWLLLLGAVWVVRR